MTVNILIFLIVGGVIGWIAGMIILALWNLLHRGSVR